MALLTVQTPTTTGAVVTYAAVAASDTMPNDGKTVIHVKNGGASSDTVTVVSQLNCSQGVNHPLTVAVPNGSDRIIGPFDISRFNDPTTGYITIQHSYTTSVTIACLRVSP